MKNELPRLPVIGMEPKSDGFLHPAPEADAQEVSRWLNQVRTGALVAFASLLIGLVLVILFALGVTPSSLVGRAVPVAAMMVGTVALWMLVSPEPGNWRWLWRSRWVVRVGQVALLVASVASLIVYGFIEKLPEGFVPEKQVQSYVNWASFGVSLLFLRYMRTLSRRLRDRLLSGNFAVLYKIGLIMLILVVILWGMQGHLPQGGAAAGATTKPATKTLSAGQRTFWACFQLTVFGYGFWLLWLLVRRLGRTAENYRALPVSDTQESGQLVPPIQGPPGDL